MVSGQAAGVIGAAAPHLALGDEVRAGLVDLDAVHQRHELLEGVGRDAVEEGHRLHLIAHVLAHDGVARQAWSWSRGEALHFGAA